MNLRTLFLATLSLAGATVVSAQAPAPAAAAPATTVTVTAPFVSQYMFRGTRLGGASFQPSVEVGAGNLAAGVWTNFPMRKKVPGQSDPEVDVYASYKFEVAKDLNIQPGFTWYNYPNADKANGFYKSTFEPSIALNYTVAGVTLTPKAYYDTIMKASTYEANATYALPVKEIGSELDFIATYGTFLMREYAPTTPDIKNWGDYWLVGVSLPFQVTSNSKLVVGISYTKGERNYLKQGSDPKFENSAAVGRGVASVSYSVSF